MPVPFTAAQIKAWFETADLPTQQQFADLVDTLFYQNQQALDTAQDALDAVADVPRMGFLTLAGVGGPDETPAVTKRREAGLTFTTAVGAYVATGADPEFKFTVTITVTFDTASADANYPAYITVSDGVFSATVLATSRTTGGCEFVFEGAADDNPGGGFNRIVRPAQVCFHAWP